MRSTLPLVLLTALAGCSSDTSSASESDSTDSGANSTDSGERTPAGAASTYTVDVYDPARDASADLVATIARANGENKRILLEVGGLW